MEIPDRNYYNWNCKHRIYYFNNNQENETGFIYV